MASHTVYAVASGKGGVGKTATTVNLGASLAAAGYKVAIVDTDLGMANLGGFIGVETDATLHEVLAGDASLEEATYRALNGLAVVPSSISLNGFANVETAALSDAVGALREAFDYVLLDLGAGLSHDTVLPLALADAVILVSTPQPMAIQDTAKTRQITERLGGRVAGVVLTRAGSPADLSLEEISDTLELPILAVIPEHDAVPASAREGEAVLQYDEDSPAVEGYGGLAHIIEEESLESAPVVPEMPADEPGASAASARERTPESTDGPADAEEPEPESSESGASAPTESEQPSDGTPGAGNEPTPEPAEGGPADSPAESDDAATGIEAGDSGDATAESDDAETTAAEIAAAIEDAASTAGGASDGSEPDSTAQAGSEAATAAVQDAGTGGTATDEPSRVEQDETAESDAVVDPDAVGESDAAVETAAADEGTEPPAGENAEPEAFKVESDDDDGEEAEAVDQLFSVEGADPEEIEDEEEESSGGLFGRFLG